MQKLEGLTEQEWADLNRKFEAQLDEYIDKWGEAVRQHIQSLEAAPAKKARKARRSRKKGKGHA
jgi:hypothetical protein